MRVRSVVGRNALRDARPRMEEEAVEDRGMLEQVDKGTWESQDNIECEKTKQDDIDMKYEEGGIEWLRRVRHGGRIDVLLSLTKEMRTRKTVLVGHEGTMRWGKVGCERVQEPGWSPFEKKKKNFVQTIAR
jgi:hypothetical protein